MRWSHSRRTGRAASSWARTSAPSRPACASAWPRDHMLRSWVLQFESRAQDPLPTPPAAALASWGTHDLARFEAYFWGIDIDENERAGHLSATEATTKREERETWRAAMLVAIGATRARPQQDRRRRGPGAGRPALLPGPSGAEPGGSRHGGPRRAVGRAPTTESAGNRPGGGELAAPGVAHARAKRARTSAPSSSSDALHALRQAPPTDRVVVPR